MRVSLLILLTCLLLAVPLAVSADEAAVQKAIAEYDLENFDEALSILNASRKQGDTSTRNSYYTGLCLKQMGEYEGAAESLKAALKGSDPYKEAVVELLSVLMGLDRLDEAMEWVQWAEKEKVKPKEVAYSKGLILAKKGDYSEARAAFVAAKTGNPENDRQVELQIALMHAQEGDVTTARASLNAIVTRYPGTDTATFAQEYNQRMGTAAAPSRNWSFYAGFNYMYDDNVMLKSTDKTVVTDPRNETNSAFSENIRFEYDVPLASSWAANVQYTLQNNNYTRLHDYNMFNQGLTASPIYRGNTLIFSLPVNFSHTTLDYRNYSLQVSVKPTATIVINPRNLIQASAGYTRRILIKDPTAVEENRTAKVYGGQAGYIFLYDEGRGMVNLRGEVARDDANGINWRNLGTRIGTDVLVPVTRTTRFILTAEGAWQDYDESLTGRKDTTFTGSLTLNQQLIKNLYANFQYIYTRAYSNVATYDYQRNVIMTGIELRF